MDVSKYSVERNHQDEAKWVAFFRSVDFALGNTVLFFCFVLFLFFFLGATEDFSLVFLPSYFVHNILYD